MTEEHDWKFAQCFGDKGDSDDVTEGMFALQLVFGPFKQRRAADIISTVNLTRRRLPRHW